MSSNTFEYYHGLDAYLIWQAYFGFKYDYDTIRIFDQFLEIITNTDFVVYAYRSNLPIDLSCLVTDDGLWKYTRNIHILESDDVCKFYAICRDYSFN